MKDGKASGEYVVFADGFTDPVMGIAVKGAGDAGSVCSL